MPKEIVRQQSLFPEFVIDDREVDDAEGDFVDSSRLGRYAEFIVCAELTRLGYHALHVDAPGFDIILTVEDRSLRVQVKSTATIKHPVSHAKIYTKRMPSKQQAVAVWNCKRHTQASNGGNRTDRSPKRLTICDADVVALFHHKFKTVIFFPIQSVPASGRFELPLTQIKHDAAEESLKATLDCLLGL
jgi:hypothetical protein